VFPGNSSSDHVTSPERKMNKQLVILHKEGVYNERTEQAKPHITGV